MFAYLPGWVVAPAAVQADHAQHRHGFPTRGRDRWRPTRTCDGILPLWSTSGATNCGEMLESVKTSDSLSNRPGAG